jgi:hypothetical protein
MAVGASKSSPSLTLERTLHDPTLQLDANLHALDLTVDAAGALALVEQRHVGGGVLAATLWDLRTGTTVPGAWTHLTRDGRYALRREGRAIVVVDLTTREVVSEVPPGLYSICPSGPFVVEHTLHDAPDAADAGKEEPTTRVHDLGTGALRHTLATKARMATFVAGARLATVSARGALTVWDLATGKIAGKGKGPSKPRAVRADPSGSRLLISAADGRYAVFDAGSCALLHEGPSRMIASRDAAFDGRTVVGINWWLDVTRGTWKGFEDGWLPGERHSSVSSERLRTLEPPRAFVLTKRALIGAPVAELWDVAASEKLASAEVAAHAGAIDVAGDTLVVAHGQRRRTGEGVVDLSIVRMGP